MRSEPTHPEAILWALLRDRRLEGYKFRRQVPIGNFIVDFFCPSARLILELDGSQHANAPRDRRRDAWLSAQEYRVLRIWNNDLTENRDGVFEAIWATVNDSPPHPAAAQPPSPSRGEGTKEVKR